MPRSADMVFRNGYVYTADNSRTVAEAAAVEDGKIAFVGSNAEAEPWIGDGTKVIDLEGKLLMPSFFEAHGHAQALAQLLYSTNVTGLESVEEYAEAVKVFIQEHRNYEFILGNGWTNAIFPPTGPRKEVLDAISMDIPIAIWSEDHHSLWVNSRALDVAGITKETPNPFGGVIERDVTGEPSGTIRESAADLVMHVIPDFTVEQYKKAIKEYQNMANSLGFTGVFDPVLPVGGNAIKAYKMLSQSGELTMRVRGAYVTDPEKGPEQIKSFVDARFIDNENDLFQINTVKIFADGVIEGGTAYLLEPYAEGARRKKDYRGLPVWETGALNEMFDNAEKEGFNIHVHSVGDAATRETLDGLANAERQNGKKDYRNAITHLQIVDPTDILRCKELDVIGVINPYWAIIGNYYYELEIPYLGQKRAEEEYPIQSFIKEGVKLASASDFPVTDCPNPLLGIEIGVTRTSPDDLLKKITSDPQNPKYKKPLWCEEKASLEDMIDTFTYNGAYANFLEKETGSIEVGKSADMIVLDQNLFRIPETEISNTKVLLTLFQGKEVFIAGHSFHDCWHTRISFLP